jgi:hypothetical protein
MKPLSPFSAENIHPMKRCKGCGGQKVTWAEQRKQYGRAIRHGLTPDEAKALMPRCQKCLTKALERGVARSGTRSTGIY